MTEYVLSYDPEFGKVPFSYNYIITGRVENVQYRSHHSADDYKEMTCFIAMAAEADESSGRKWRYHSSNSEAMCQFADKCFLLNISIRLYGKVESGDNHVVAVEYAGTKATHWQLGT